MNQQERGQEQPDTTQNVTVSLSLHHQNERELKRENRDRKEDGKGKQELNEEEKSQNHFQIEQNGSNNSSWNMNPHASRSSEMREMKLDQRQNHSDLSLDTQTLSKELGNEEQKDNAKNNLILENEGKMAYNKKESFIGLKYDGEICQRSGEISQCNESIFQPVSLKNLCNKSCTEGHKPDKVGQNKVECQNKGPNSEERSRGATVEINGNILNRSGHILNPQMEHRVEHVDDESYEEEKESCKIKALPDLELKEAVQNQDNKKTQEMEREKYQDIIEKYERATDIDPTYKETFCKWGDALFKQNKYQEAIEKYEQASIIDPTCKEAYLGWGVALFNQNKYQEAAEKYERATIIDSTSKEAYLGWGVALFNQNKYQEAVEKYERATIIDPTFKEAYLGWGNALYNQKKYQEAVEKYERATLIDPTYKEAYYNWVVALIDQKKYQEAADKYKRVLIFDSNNAHVFRCWQEAFDKYTGKH